MLPIIVDKAKTAIRVITVSSIRVFLPLIKIIGFIIISLIIVISNSDSGFLLGNTSYPLIRRRKSRVLYSTNKSF